MSRQTGISLLKSVWFTDLYNSGKTIEGPAIQKVASHILRFENSVRKPFFSNLYVIPYIGVIYWSIAHLWNNRLYFMLWAASEGINPVFIPKFVSVPWHRRFVS